MNKAIRPATYQEEVAQYTKKDAVHALFFALYISLLGVGFWALITSD